MKLGFMTACLPDVKLPDLVAWASANGFGMLEIACWPMGEKDRRYGGVSHIDVANLTPEKAREIVDDFAAHDLEISSLGYYPNYLHPDPEHRERVLDHFKKVIEAAKMLGVEVAGTFIGRDPSKNVEENLVMFRKIFPGLVKFAAEGNVRIAIENCPMLFPDTWPGGTNLASTPEIWEVMFEAIPDENFGLNLDPSHLIWQGIDYVQAVLDFGPRIFHTHAKDTKFFIERLNKTGYLGFGWHEDRLPGLGDIDWQAHISALYEVGYDYVISIEHEDRNWEENEEAVKRGLLLAKRYLEPLIG